MPEIPCRDAGVTAVCLACGGPRPPGRGRRYCGHPCQQRAYRARHAPDPAIPPAAPPPGRFRTASGVYECPGCGERQAGARRCPECNLYGRRVGSGGCCPACGDAVTIEELLEAATT